VGKGGNRLDRGPPCPPSTPGGGRKGRLGALTRSEKVKLSAEEEGVSRGRGKPGPLTFSARRKKEEKGKLLINLG